MGCTWEQPQLPHHVVHTILDPTVVSLKNETVIRHLKRTLVQVFFLILKVLFFAVAYKPLWNLE